VFTYTVGKICRCWAARGVTFKGTLRRHRSTRSLVRRGSIVPSEQSTLSITSSHPRSSGNHKLHTFTYSRRRACQVVTISPPWTRGSGDSVARSVARRSVTWRSVTWRSVNWTLFSVTP